MGDQGETCWPVVDYIGLVEEVSWFFFLFLFWLWFIGGWSVMGVDVGCSW